MSLGPGRLLSFRFRGGEPRCRAGESAVQIRARHDAPLLLGHRLSLSQDYKKGLVQPYRQNPQAHRLPHIHSFIRLSIYQCLFAHLHSFTVYTTLHSFINDVNVTVNQHQNGSHLGPRWPFGYCCLHCLCCPSCPSSN